MLRRTQDSTCLRERRAKLSMVTPIAVLSEASRTVSGGIAWIAVPLLQSNCSTHSGRKLKDCKDSDSERGS